MSDSAKDLNERLKIDECEKCGENCVCVFKTSPVSNAYWGLLTKEDEDMLIRDLIILYSTQLTPEQIAEAEENAAWFEFTDDGLKMSKGMSELLQKMGKDLLGEEDAKV